jgi:Fe-Mn family superoxide dismutase
MYTLPELPYEYNALAPIISADIMELHHSKHHQTYVDKLNVAIDQAPELKSKASNEEALWI